MLNKVIPFLVFFFILIGMSNFIFADNNQQTETITNHSSSETYNKADPYQYTGENGFPGYSGFMPDSGTIWDKLWGVKPQNSLNIGLWTLHLSPGSIKTRNWDNQGVFATYDMFYVGTFLNSFWERAYSAGIQRNFYQDQITDHTKLILGYRLGAIYGYGGSIKEYTPVIPLAQLIARLQYRIFGIEFQYSGIIVSTSLYFTF